ncbi:MAG: methyltransferase domain-containing protein [Alphaproteobacteria bacterium]|nr:methyltransferase domain-containing protein [Alphaproteobacteria bacterium]
MLIYDCFTIFNELDLLDLRLNELSSVVDTFVIAESPVTFQGNPKPLYFQENRARFAKFADKINHVIVDDMPVTQNPWQREYHQRNALRRGFADAPPDATIMISDVDEIPSPAATRELADRKDFAYFELKLFVYFLNYQVLEGDDAPTIASYGAPMSQIQGIPDLTAPRNGSPDNYLNSRNMRELVAHLIHDAGWHFSWLGNAEHILQKMNAFSHTEERYRKWSDAESLSDAIASRQFFLYDSGVSVRPIEDMPMTVQNARGAYQQKGLLAPEMGQETGCAAHRIAEKEITPAPRPEKTRPKPDHCPVCGNASFTPSAFKHGVQYYSCPGCSALFSGRLDGTDTAIPDGTAEARANIELQKTRLKRIAEHLGRRPETILDFGCGRGDFVAFLNERGVKASGIDKHTALQSPGLAPQSLDAVAMVEVIAHLDDPNAVMARLADCLKPGGIIYIESSFADFLGNPARSDYVDPRIGHCCIPSQKSIHHLAEKFKMREIWINNNVVALSKAPAPAARQSGATAQTRLSSFWS